MADLARVKQVLADPKRLRSAMLRRIIPNHPRYGNPWVRLPDGNVSFRERGFVAADSPSSLLGRHNYEVSKIRTSLEGLTIGDSLEIGCGFGRLTPTLASHAQRHVGVDVNTEALSAAEAMYPKLKFEYGSAVNLPFPTDSFDLVTTWTVLQHVDPDRIGDAAREIKRVLRSGGTLVTCEETRHAGRTGKRVHTWHRQVDEYAQLFAPLQLVSTDNFTDMPTVAGVEPPGTLMVWR